MPNPSDNPLGSDLYTVVLEAIKELLPRNYIGGLITSNDAGDALHDVNIAAGECRSADDSESLRLATEITKQIDAAWAVGDDAGGMDTGAVAADTMYAVWLIKRVDTGVVDALFSLSFTAPTMPTNYTKKRLIGAVRTDGSADVIAFTQSGDYFRYTGDVIVDVTDATITDVTFEEVALSVPPSCVAHIYGQLTNLTTTSTSSGLWIRTKGSADGTVLSEAFMQIRTSGTFDQMTSEGQVLVDSDRKIEYAASESDGGATVTISTLGFMMLTRKEP